MKLFTFFAITLPLGMMLGGKERCKRAAQAGGAGAMLGCLLGVAYCWLRPLFAFEYPITLTGIGQAAHAINWLGVWFVAGFFSLAGGVRGFFLVGQPSRGVETFHDLWTLWDLFTFWRH